MSFGVLSLAAVIGLLILSSPGVRATDVAGVAVEVPTPVTTPSPVEPDATSSPTPTPTPTASPTETGAVVPTPIDSVTPATPPTESASPVPTASPTAIPSPTPTPTSVPIPAVPPAIATSTISLTTLLIAVGVLLASAILVWWLMRSRRAAETPRAAFETAEVVPAPVVLDSMAVMGTAMIDSGYPVGLVRDALEDLATASGRPTVEAVVFPTSILVSSSDQRRGADPSRVGGRFVLSPVPGRHGGPDRRRRTYPTAGRRVGQATYPGRCRAPDAVHATAADRRIRGSLSRAQCAARRLGLGSLARGALGTRCRSRPLADREAVVQFPGAGHRRGVNSALRWSCS